jgi:hypothetical protein
MTGFYVELKKAAYFSSEVEAPDLETAIVAVKAMAGGYDEWTVIAAHEIARHGETTTKDLDEAS